MKCLRRYKWVQLPRKEIPKLKGKLGFWLHLAERAAFRKGYATYCGHKNLVEPGMWTGGIVGVKAILGVRSREKAFQALDDLQELGYLTYSHNSGTKEEWFCLRMPLIISKKNGYSVKYVENRIRAALEDFWNYRPRMGFSYDKAVIVFHHMYGPKRNLWEHCVPADCEVECVIRMIFVHVLHQIFPISFRHYHCCSLGEEELTEVYVMPISDFDKWLAQETPYLMTTPKRDKLYACPADARKAQKEDGRKD